MIDKSWRRESTATSVTTVLSKLLTSCLTAVKKLWIRHYDTVYKRDGINYFWSIKNSNEVLNKFKSKNLKASKLSTYDFSRLYTTLPHNLIKDKLIDLINRTFIRENTQYLACNEECAFYAPAIFNGGRREGRGAWGRGHIESPMSVHTSVPSVRLSRK